MTDLSELTKGMDTSPKLYVTIYEGMEVHGRVMTSSDIKSYLDMYAITEHSPNDIITIKSMS